MSEIKAWGLSLAPENPDRAPAHLFGAAQQYPCELCISPSGRVCAFAGAAKLESEELANKLKGTVIDSIKDQYGQESEIEIIKYYFNNSPVHGKKHIEKISSDSEKARIAINRFSQAKTQKASSKKIMDKGWAVTFEAQKIGAGYYAESASIKKGSIGFTTTINNAKVYKSMKAAQKRAESIGNTHSITALVVEIPMVAMNSRPPQLEIVKS